MHKVEGGDVVNVGQVPVKFIHTPGHTPGSQCFLVGDALVSGDTLFIGACGRVDLPGSDPKQLYESLNTLGKLPESTRLYPGSQLRERAILDDRRAEAPQPLHALRRASRTFCR